MLEDHEHNKPVHNFDGIIENRVTSPPVYFNVLFYGLIIWAVIFIAFYLLSGWSSDAEFQEKMTAHETRYQQAAPSPSGGPATKESAAATPAASEADGAAIFAERCAMCHGTDGGGGVGPALNAPEYIYGRSDEAIRESIANGRENGMPAFGNQLTNDELAAVATYVLTLK